MRFLLLLVGIAILIAPGSLLGQNRQHSQKLQAAVNHINNLKTDSAIRLAREVLNSRPSRQDSILALKVLAGAYYPEHREAQKRERAVEILRVLVDRFPNESATLPEDILWRDLDRLHREVRSQRLAIITERERLRRRNQVGRTRSDLPVTQEETPPWRPPSLQAEVRVPARIELNGRIGKAGINVRASTPSKFKLELIKRDGRGERMILAETESAGYTGTLEFWFVGKDGDVFIVPGSYDLVLTAEDIYGARVQRQYLAVIEGPPPPAVPIPTLDPQQLRPERMVDPWGNFAWGGVLAGLTALPLLTPRSYPLNELDTDRRGSIVAGVILTAGFLAAFLDRGVLIQENVDFNQQLRQELQRQVDAAKATAGQYDAVTYRAFLVIT